MTREESRHQKAGLKRKNTRVPSLAAGDVEAQQDVVVRLDAQAEAVAVPRRFSRLQSSPVREDAPAVREQRQLQRGRGLPSVLGLQEEQLLAAEAEGGVAAQGVAAAERLLQVEGHAAPLGRVVARTRAGAAPARAGASRAADVAAGVHRERGRSGTRRRRGRRSASTCSAIMPPRCGLNGRSRPSKSSRRRRVQEVGLRREPGRRARRRTAPAMVGTSSFVAGPDERLE